MSSEDPGPMPAGDRKFRTRYWRWQAMVAVLLLAGSALRLLRGDSLLAVFDLAVVVAAIAYLVLSSIPVVGTRLGALVVTTTTELRSHRVLAWADLVAFDHPESRYGGHGTRGPVEVLTSAGEVVGLPEVTETAEFLGVLGRRLPGPVNIRVPKGLPIEPSAEG